MESEFVVWLGTPAGIFCMILVGLVTLFGALWFKSSRTAIRKWEADFGAKLNDLGFPSWFTAAFVAASQGNLAEALGDAQKAIKMSETPAGQTEVLTGLLLKAKADPNRWAVVKKVVADVEGGIDPTADISAGIQAGPWGKLTAPPTPGSVLKSDMQGIVAHIQAAAASAKATGDSFLSHVNDQLTAAGHGSLLPVIAATAAAVAPPAAPALAAGAVADAAVNAAVGALQSATVTLPPGHTATVTNTTAPTAAA